MRIRWKSNVSPAETGSLSSKGAIVRTAWEAEAEKRGFVGEKEMWQALYPAKSLSQLAEEFKVGINTIRTRIDKCGQEVRSRGGANNQKLVIDDDLITDIVKMGVVKSAAKRGVRPQVIYQAVYYKYGLTIKGLKEQQTTNEAKTTDP